MSSVDSCDLFGNLASTKQFQWIKTSWSEANRSEQFDRLIGSLRTYVCGGDERSRIVYILPETSILKQVPPPTSSYSPQRHLLRRRNSTSEYSLGTVQSSLDASAPSWRPLADILARIR